MLHQTVAHRDRTDWQDDHEPFEQEQSAARHQRPRQVLHAIPPVRDFSGQSASPAPSYTSSLRQQARATPSRWIVGSRILTLLCHMATVLRPLRAESARAAEESGGISRNQEESV